MDIIPVTGILSSFGAAVLIVYFVTKARSRRVEVQSEMQTKLIERFGSAPDLVGFLQSPAGREFVAGVQTAPAILVRERILSGFSRSIVVTAVGLAFVFLSLFDNADFMVPAAILSSLGLGFFLATLVSYKLSASMRIGDDQPHA